jgi:hypothetical protein
LARGDRLARLADLAQTCLLKLRNEAQQLIVLHDFWFGFGGIHGSDSE